MTASALDWYNLASDFENGIYDSPALDRLNSSYRSSDNSESK